MSFIRIVSSLLILFATGLAFSLGELPGKGPAPPAAAHFSPAALSLTALPAAGALQAKAQTVPQTEQLIRLTFSPEAGSRWASTLEFPLSQVRFSRRPLEYLLQAGISGQPSLILAHSYTGAYYLIIPAGEFDQAQQWTWEEVERTVSDAGLPAQTVQENTRQVSINGLLTFDPNSPEPLLAQIVALRNHWRETYGEELYLDALLTSQPSEGNIVNFTLYVSYLDIADLRCEADPDSGAGVTCTVLDDPITSTILVFKTSGQTETLFLNPFENLRQEGIVIAASPLGGEFACYVDTGLCNSADFFRAGGDRANHTCSWFAHVLGLC